MLPFHHAVYIDSFLFMVKSINLLFSACFATGCIHSGETKIFKVVGKS